MVRDTSLKVTANEISPYAVHQHPQPEQPFVPNPAQPGHVPNGYPGPTEAIPLQRLNELDLGQRQATLDRLEASSRGHESVFSP
jgi:hypothetical protein